MHLIRRKYLGKKLPLLASLRAGSAKYSAKAGKHVMKHKGKYTAGAVGLSGLGLYSAAKSDNLGKLKKSDPRYKALKKKGYV